MTIFKYELKQLKSSIAIWSASLATAIFLMLPVYIEMLTGVKIESVEAFTNGGYFEALGTNIELLRTPLGVYAFLTSYVLLACAINGMTMGLTVITKEYRQRTADFLMTKPHSRSKIFLSKLLATSSAALIIGSTYFLASWAGMSLGTEEDYAFMAMALMAFGTVFIQLLFLAMGMFVGVAAPRIRAHFSIAAGTAFVTYIFGTYSRKMSNAFVGHFSPSVYFDGADIITTGRYDLKYLMLFAVWMAIFMAAGHRIYCKKDVILVS